MLQSTNMPPINGASSRPETGSTNYSKQLAGVALNDDLKETEAILQKNFQRLKAHLLDEVDSKVGKLESKCNDQEKTIKQVLNDKEMMGVKLYESNYNLGRLNDTLAKLQMRFNKTDSKSRMNQSELDGAKLEIQSAIDENKKNNHTIAQLTKELGDARTKISHLQVINNGYTSNLKIHKNLQTKLEKDIEREASKKKELVLQIEAGNKRNEELLDQKKEADLLLQKQRQETAKAQNTIHSMHREISQITRTNQEIKKKWEDAFASMMKRDEALTKVQDTQKQKDLKTWEIENQLRMIKIEKEKADKLVHEKDQELESLRIQMAKLKTHLSETEEKNGKRAQDINNIYQKDIEDLTKNNRIALEELERKNAQTSELKTKIEAMKVEFENKMKNEFIVRLSHKEEVIRNDIESGIDNVVKERTRESVTLHSQNAELKLKLQDLTEKVGVSNDSLSKLQFRYDEVQGHYVKLYDETKHLIYALERKEHDINYLKSKINNDNDGVKANEYQLSLTRLQKELTAAKAANDHLQTLWITNQKETIKNNELVQSLTAENSVLKSKISISDLETVKRNSQIEVVKKEGIDDRLEAAKLYKELKKLQPVINELKNKNLLLEAQLVDAKLELEESRHDDTTNSHMLKTEIRRLYKDKNTIQKVRLQDERSSSVIERKYLLAKEKLDKLQVERHEMLKNNFNLKCRYEDVEKKYRELKSEYKNFSEMARKNVTDLTRVNKVEAKPAWSSLMTTPGQTNEGLGKISRTPSSISDSKHNTGGMPDFDAWRLKLTSLSTERDFYVNENEMVKAKLIEFANKNTTLEKQISESNNKLKRIEDEIQSVKTDWEAEKTKAQRAERIAAHIEKQLKDLTPNFKINYQLIGSVEPSTQLIAAMMIKDVPPLPLKSTYHAGGDLKKLRKKVY